MGRKLGGNEMEEKVEIVGCGALGAFCLSVKPSCCLSVLVALLESASTSIYLEGRCSETLVIISFCLKEMIAQSQ
ncbi:hypothetical protein LR48_Vigan05g067800 [Vigna angularis]|uniref:Uncharacterized protein n=1 Tax=Phaseolus angularis TaxID=3914 RepID=A0A0L9UKJ6_PHAAN|nr:hypothetical protein LR48_Vigan05g067800 [Vigna angularis]